MAIFERFFRRRPPEQTNSLIDQSSADSVDIAGGGDAGSQESGVDDQQENQPSPSSAEAPDQPVISETEPSEPELNKDQAIGQLGELQHVLREIQNSPLLTDVKEKEHLIDVRGSLALHVHSLKRTTDPDQLKQLIEQVPAFIEEVENLKEKYLGAADAVTAEREQKTKKRKAGGTEVQSEPGQEVQEPTKTKRKSKETKAEREEAIKRLAQQIFDSRMKGEISGSAIDKILDDKGIKPWSPAAEKFMREWDWLQAEKIHDGADDAHPLVKPFYDFYWAGKEAAGHARKKVQADDEAPTPTSDAGATGTTEARATGTEAQPTARPETVNLDQLLPEEREKYAAAQKETEKILEELAKELGEVRGKHGEKFAKVEEWQQWFDKVAAVKEQFDVPLVLKAEMALEAARQLLQEYRGEAQFIALQEEFKDIKGSEFLSKEKIESVSPQIWEVVENFIKNGKLTKEALASDSLKKLKDDMGFTGDKEFIKFLEDVIEQSRNFAIEDLRQKEKEAQAAAGAPAKLGIGKRLATFASKIGSSMAVNMGLGMGAGHIAATIAAGAGVGVGFIGTGGIGLAGAALGVAGYRGVSRWLRNRAEYGKYGDMVDKAVKSPAADDETKKLYQANINDTVRAVQLERLEKIKDKKEGRSKKASDLESVRDQYRKGQIKDHEELRNKLTESIENIKKAIAVKKEAAKHFPEYAARAEEEQLKQMEEAMKSLYLFESGLLVERQLDEISKQQKVLDTKKPSVWGATKEMTKGGVYGMAGRVAARLPIVGTALASAGGWKMGEALAQEVLSQEDWYNKHEKLYKNVARYGGAAAMGAISFFSGATEGFTKEWMESGFKSAGAGVVKEFTSPALFEHKAGDTPSPEDAEARNAWNDLKGEETEKSEPVEPEKYFTNLEKELGIDSKDGLDEEEQYKINEHVESLKDKADYKEMNRVREHYNSILSPQGGGAAPILGKGGVEGGIKYQGGGSIWSEAEKQFAARFKEPFVKLDEAGKTWDVDLIKDKIVADPEKYGLPADVDVDTVTPEQLGKIDWDKAFADSGMTADKVDPHLSDEKVKSILEHNKDIREWAKAHPDEKLTSEKVSEILGSQEAAAEPQQSQAASAEGAISVEVQQKALSQKLGEDMENWATGKVSEAQLAGHIKDLGKTYGLNQQEAGQFVQYLAKMDKDAGGKLSREDLVMAGIYNEDAVEFDNQSFKQVMEEFKATTKEQVGVVAPTSEGEKANKQEKIEPAKQVSPKVSGGEVGDLPGAGVRPGEATAVEDKGRAESVSDKKEGTTDKKPDEVEIAPDQKEIVAKFTVHATEVQLTRQEVNEIDGLINNGARRLLSTEASIKGVAEVLKSNEQTARETLAMMQTAKFEKLGDLKPEQLERYDRVSDMITSSLVKGGTMENQQEILRMSQLDAYLDHLRADKGYGPASEIIGHEEQPESGPLDLSGPAITEHSKQLAQELSRGLLRGARPEQLAEYTTALAGDLGLEKGQEKLFINWLAGKDGVLKKDDLGGLVAEKGKLNLEAFGAKLTAFEQLADSKYSPGESWEPRILRNEKGEKYLANVRFKPEIKGITSLKPYEVDIDGDGKREHNYNASELRSLMGAK